jgi:hypothetical protein
MENGFSLLGIQEAFGYFREFYADPDVVLERKEMCKRWEGMVLNWVLGIS